MWCTRLPLQWLDFGGNPVNDIFTPAHPFIDLELSKDMRGAEANWMPVRALVDTGSSFSLVSPLYLERLGATPVGIRGLSGNFAKTDAQFYRLCIRAADAKHFTLCADVGPLEIELEGAECHAILGMDYLRLGRLVVEPPPGDSYFDLHEQKIRSLSASVPGQSR